MEKRTNSLPTVMRLPGAKGNNTNGLTLLLRRVINVKFSLQPHQKYFVTHYEKPGFSLLPQMKGNYTIPILTTSLLHFSLKAWENVVFGLGSKRD